MTQSDSHFQIIIIGAGISGLAAATALQASGFSVLILDKGRGVGGRMATRKYGDAWFDHGAQFITAHGPEFQRELNSWVDMGVLGNWFEKSEGNIRYRGIPSMTAGPKHLANNLSLRLGTKVEQVSYFENQWTVDAGITFTCDHLVLAFPVPQALAVLDQSRVQLPNEAESYLRSISYNKCLSALLTLEKPSQLPQPGLIRYESCEPIELIVDNQVKGVSRIPTLTVHAGPEFSDHYFDNRDKALSILLQIVSDKLSIRILDAAIHGWRFSKREGESDQSFYALDSLQLYFTGDSFGPPRIEGAFLSGQATASHILKASERSILCKILL